MSCLSLDTLSVTLRGRQVLGDISLEIGAGELVGLIGPNGAGKTTLLRAALGLIPATGHSSLAAMAPEARARAAAWMPQAREIAWPVTVEALITLGRTPHLGFGQSPAPDDLARVDEVIGDLDLAALRHRRATNLSGGEQARVLLARALVQDTPLIMADEPIAGLDPAHQITTMRHFADLADSGRSVLVSLHDLGLAVRHCTRLLLLDQGRIVADGRPDAVLTQARLAETFGITAHLARTAQGPVFQPLDVVR